mgnify:CR=1 FL=1
MVGKILEAMSAGLPVVATQGCYMAEAARAGALIGHDFCCISLSDLLTPWDVIEKRLKDAFPGVAFEVHGTPKDEAGARDLALRDKYQFQWWAVSLVDAVPWGVKTRLTHEKTAIGFYLSGHLFDEVEREVRQFVRRSIDELIDSREPQLIAGIVSDLRIINGQRGKVAIFKLDDKSGVMEATADEGLINSARHALKDDELIIVMAKMQMDRFSGGFRLKIEQIWDLGAARCRFGKFLRVQVNGHAPDIERLVREFPPQREVTEHGELVKGLPVRLSLQRRAGDVAAKAELALGERARFFPSDAALASWMAQADQGLAQIVYDESQTIVAVRAVAM